MRRIMRNMQCGVVTATLMGLANAGWDFAATGSLLNVAAVLGAGGILWGSLGIAETLLDAFCGTPGAR